MTIKIKLLHEDAVLPSYAHGALEDAGMDLRTIADVLLYPGVSAALPTGLSIEIPSGYEAQIRPRSGLAFQHGVTVANSPGTIDPSYRGELKVMLINLGHEAYRVKAGDRVAQLVVAKYEAVQWEESVALAESVRGANGLGSSGKN